MLDEAHFYAITAATMMHIHDQLEQAFDRGDLEELDYDEGSGLLTIITQDETTFIVSRHGPSRQLWLASPVSGGLHFDYVQDAQDWVLPDGRLLKAILADDLLKRGGIRVVL
jgi:iron donor protein CyaY